MKEGVPFEGQIHAFCEEFLQDHLILFKCFVNVAERNACYLQFLLRLIYQYSLLIIYTNIVHTFFFTFAPSMPCTPFSPGIPMKPFKKK